LKNGSLLIKDVFNNDKKNISEGLESYRCVAFVDDIGVVVSRTASVILARKLNFMKNYNYLFTNNNYTGLSFEKQPTDLRLLPGQTAHFSCLVNSQPLQKIIWLKDHSPLVIDNRMTIFPSGKIIIFITSISVFSNLFITTDHIDNILQAVDHLNFTNTRKTLFFCSLTRLQHFYFYYFT